MKKFVSMVLVLIMISTMAVTAFATDTMATDDSNTYVQSDEKTFTITNEDTEDTDSIYEDGNKWNIGVQAGFDDTAAAASAGDDVYYVVVEWNVSSTLQYTLESNAYCWTVYADEEGKDEAESGEAKSAGYILNYDKGQWSGKAEINVTVTNWSNVDITYEMTWAPATAAASNDKVHTDIEFADGSVKINETTDTDNDAGNLEAVVDKDTAETDKLYTTAHTATSTVSIDGDNGGITGAIKADDALIGTLTVAISQVTESTETPEENN